LTSDGSGADVPAAPGGRDSLVSRPPVAPCLMLITAGLSAAVLAGCASLGTPASARRNPTRSALRSYLQQVEPIRLAVNRLLDTADPILEALREHRITAVQAALRMSQLERRFAAYTVDIEAIQPAAPMLRSLDQEYAHTYILEDAYLSALVAGLAQHDLRDLPDTQAAQRAAIIAWRTGLSVIAREEGAALPADLQQAGRGEIAPAPSGS